MRKIVTLLEETGSNPDQRVASPLDCAYSEVSYKITSKNMQLRLLLVCIFLFTPFLSNAEEVVLKIYPTDDVAQFLYDEDNLRIWSEARNYAGILAHDVSTSTEIFGVRSDKNVGRYRIYRDSLLFDTSQIPDNALINSASINLYSTNYANNSPIVLTKHTRASTTNFVSADWYLVNYGSEIGRGSLIDNQYKKVDLQITDYINQKSYTDIGIMTANDYDDIDSGFQITGEAFHSSEYPGTSTDPYLEVTYTIPDEPKTTDELLSDILSYFESNAGVMETGVRQSYNAELQNFERMYADGLLLPLSNQIRALQHKIETDVKALRLDEVIGTELITQLEAIRIALGNEEVNSTDVPLITQIASPYPPESAEWADQLYADGRADYSGSCGATIAQCGCALTSLAMIGQSYGLSHGVDGSPSTPGNINDWLLTHGGYDQWGNIIWTQAVKYFSQLKNGVYESFFAEPNVITPAETETELAANHPTMIKTLATGRSGQQYTHFVTGTGVEGASHLINDPLWYNTNNLDDVRDRTSWVQDYNDLITSGRNFEYQAQPQKVARHLTVHLGSPAELVLTDSQGRKLGYDPRTGTRYTEIPNGDYYEEGAFYSEELDESGVAPHVTKILDVDIPEGELFTLEVIGTDAGEYHLSVATNNGVGVGELENVTGSTNEGTVNSFAIDVPELGSSAGAAGRLRELAEEKEAMQPEVAARLRDIADQLETKNTAALENPDVFAAING